MKRKAKIAILSVMSMLSIGAMTSCNKIETNSKTEVTATYTITFNTNGGSSVDSIKVNAGAKATKPADPTKDGFVFKGWYSNSGLTISFDFTNAINENITLYAKWEEGTTPVTTYTVTFNSNGGTEVLSQTVNSGSKVSKPTDPTKEGYRFKGWFKNEALTESYDFNLEVTSTFTLYAKWEEIVTPVTTYTVTFNSNGGTEVLSQTVNSGSKVSKPTDPTKEGYRFKGWFKNEALTESYDFNSEVTSTFTLYAKWEEAVTPITTYTVTFNSNGGTDVLSQTVNAGSSITEPADPTKNGYVFDCWCTDEALENEFDVNSAINGNLVLYARWIEDKTTDSISITKTTAGNETAVVEFAYNDDFKDSDFVAYYSTDKTNYTQIDSELISYDNNKGVIYLVGLKADNYFVKVAVDGKAENVISPAIQVSEQDRSGYAHFGYNEGIGAYNNDGTLKDGAVVVYVNDENKNTVTYDSYVGIVDILSNLSKIDKPVVIRFLDMVKTTQWDSKTYSSYSSSEILADYKNATNKSGKYYIDALLAAGANTINTDLNAGITTLNGLEKFSYGTSSDSYWNMCDISGASNVTIEGVGENAGLYQWGLTWKNCTSIEVRNLTFDKYTEDACSFEGSTDSSTLSDYANVGRIWIHNNTFTQGLNRWDVSDDQDKHEGDGATDFKRTGNITVAYNHYIENHKTGLVGSDDNIYQANITFHHNYYERCNSRMPLGRNANMHMYNNYYFGSTGTNMSIRARGYAFVENCILENCKNPFECAVGKSDKGMGDYTGAVKSYNNELTGCSGKNNATVVTSRTETVTNYNSYGQSFDTDSSIFYYDSTNQKSNVDILNETSEVKEFVLAHAGAGASYYNSLELGIVVGTKYEVTYKKVINGTESTISTSLVLEGSTTTKPSNPTLSGYKFVGWYTDNTFTTEFNFSNPITSNTSIYAKFEEVETYILTYKYNIGAEDVLIDTETYDEEVLTVAPTDPTLSGYIFKGWYTDKTYSTNFEFGSALTDNVTIYAKFEEKVVSSSFDISFNDLETGSYSNTNLEIDNATIITGSKGISIASGTTKCGEFNSTKYLDLGGSGSITSRALQFEISNQSNITVYFGTTTGRVLNLSDGTNVIATGTIDSSLTCHTFENVSAGTYYLYSANSGIKIYYVLVEEYSTSSTPIVNELSLNMYTLSRDTTNTSYNNGQYTTKYVKTIYKEGESFDSTNLTVTADDTLIEASNLEITGFSSTTGKHTITVSYGGLSETYDIYVLPQALNNLNVAVGKTFTVGGTEEINSVSYVTFNTIEQALEYLRSFVTPTQTERANLLIKAGYYNEKVVIDIPYLTITGEGTAKATYLGDENYDKTEFDFATIIEWNSLFGVEEQGFTNVTDSTQTLYVKESALYCEIKNLTISNTNNCYSYFENVVKSQAEHRALALLVQTDHFIMDGCSLLGYQDTVEFMTGRSYLNNCFITGTTDYIFGTNATVYIKNSTIHTIYNGKTNQGGWVNAFKGQNASTTDFVTYGVIYDGCTFEADSTVTEGTISLGRPWTESSAVMIMNSTISAKYSTLATQSATSGRYTNWDDNILASNAKFFEYNNSGEGAISSTITGCTVLTDSTLASNYNTFSVIFKKENGGIAYNDNWDGTTTPEAIDYSVISSTVGFNFKNYSGGTNYINCNSSSTYIVSSTSQTKLLWLTIEGCTSNGENNWLKYNNGTITFNVADACTLNLVLYNNNAMNVSLDGNSLTATASESYSSDATKFTYSITQAGTITLTGTSGYIGLIEVIF